LAEYPSPDTDRFADVAPLGYTTGNESVALEAVLHKNDSLDLRNTTVESLMDPPAAMPDIIPIPAQHAKRMLFAFLFFIA
jgi:hypothetical protein